MTARKKTTVIANVLYLVSIPFLILVLVGNTHKDTPVLSSIYFFKLDVAHIIPISVGNSELLNSVARTLGLHDFYQVGLWNFCEGYNGEGVTYCSDPESFYWFDPVEVLVNELLAGAQIALPSQVLTILKVLRIGSQIMYAFFLAGTVINFVLVLGTMLAVRSRLWTIPLAILALVSAILVSVAAIIATVISVVAKVALTAQDQLNISAEIGIKMFVFMWIAALATDFAFLLHAAMGCCCKPVSRRGEARELSKTSEDEKTQASSLPSFRPAFRRRKREESSRASG